MTLSHEVTGDGPVVALLHSTVGDRRMWDPLVPGLAGAGFRVVRGDFRGFGDSPVPDRAASDAEDVLELLGTEPFALVGASGGGRVALEIAATWPQRVTKLALLCSAWWEHEPSAELRAFWARENAATDVAAATELNVDLWVGPAASPENRDLVRRMQRHAFEVQLAATEEFPSLSTEPDVSAITAPTLVISGRHDLTDFRETAAELAKRIPDARHVELEWAGHLPSLESPERLNPLLLDFLGRP